MSDRITLDTHIDRAFLNAHVLNMLIERLLTDRGPLVTEDHLRIRQRDADALIYMAGEAVDAAQAARDTFNSLADAQMGGA